MPAFKDFAWTDFKQSYAEQWHRVVSATAANPSHHLEWLESVIETQGLSGQVRMFIQIEGGRLIGGIPYFRRVVSSFGIPMRTIETVGNLISYHQTLVCEGNRTALFQAFLEQLRDWDVVHVGNLIADGSSDAAVRDAPRVSHRTSYRGESSPYLKVSGSFDDLLASKPKKFRYKYRRRPKDLAEAGAWEMRWFEGVDADVEVFMRDMLLIEERSWKVEAGMAISRRPAEEAYTRAIFEVLAARKALVGNILYLDDKPIAYSLCYHWGGLMGQMKTSYDEEYTRLSVGSLVIDAAVQKAFELHAREFDFLGDSMPHKRAWSRSERAHVGYHLFGTGLKARLIGALKVWKQKRDSGSQSESDVSD